MIESEIKSIIRDIPDFPKEGILFKDITPILKDPHLCLRIVDAFCEHIEPTRTEVLVGVESRGFLFGMMIASRLSIPFVPVRKKGKLPAETYEETYELEYGSATLEIHKDAIEKEKRVMIHDDLLATGGTVAASSKLVTQLGASISGYSFLVGLDFLNGRSKISPFSNNIITLARY